MAQRIEHCILFYNKSLNAMNKRPRSFISALYIANLSYAI